MSTYPIVYPPVQQPPPTTAHLPIQTSTVTQDEPAPTKDPRKQPSSRLLPPTQTTESIQTTIQPMIAPPAASETPQVAESSADESGSVTRAVQEMDEGDAVNGTIEAKKTVEDQLMMEAALTSGISENSPAHEVQPATGDVEMEAVEATPAVGEPTTVVEETTSVKEMVVDDAAQPAGEASTAEPSGVALPVVQSVPSTLPLPSDVNITSSEHPTKGAMNENGSLSPMSSLSGSSSPATTHNKQPLFAPEEATTPAADSAVADGEDQFEGEDEIEDDDDEEDVPLRLASSSGGAVASTSKQPMGTSQQHKERKPRHSGTHAQRRYYPNSIPLPHHEIHRGAGTENDPHLIKILAGITDGVQDRWPAPDLRVLNRKDPHDHRFNFYVEQSAGDAKYEQFLLKTGQGVASLMGLTRPTTGGKAEVWKIDRFPDNYKYFIHRTGGVGASVPDRQDNYVFGSTATAKFRTANELAPHLFWLLTSGPTNPIECDCRYCTGKKQGDVNRDFGFTAYTGSHRSTPTGSGHKRHSSVDSRQGSPTAVKKIKKLDGTTAVVTSKPKAKVGRPSTSGAKVAAVVRSVAASRPAKVEEKTANYSRAYVAKDRDEDLRDGALFRRGEMVWAKLKKPFLHPSGNTALSITHWPGLISARQVQIASTSLPPVMLGGLPRFSNKQTYTYSIKLLAVSDQDVFTEADLVSWLAFSPPSDLYNGNDLAAQESVRLVWNGKDVLRPTLKAIKSVFQAVTPFALSMQIAAHVIACYSLGDRYPVTSSHIQNLGPLTDADRKEQKHHITKSHYQSLWWGAELIWTGELVRVLSQPQSLPATSQPKADYGRSLFFKIEAIYKDPGDGSSNSSGVIMIAGAVYELQEASASLTNGGGISPAQLSKALYLPEPPAGFVFSRLTPKDVEVHLDAECIAGRYTALPSNLSNKASIDRIAKELESVTEVTDEYLQGGFGTLDTEKRALALAGLVSAHKLFMRCCHWKVDRAVTMVTAEENASGEMATYFQSRSQGA